MKKLPILAFTLVCLNASAQLKMPDHLVGDVGGAAFITQSIIKGDTNSQKVLPYMYFDYQNAFARIDTFGLKTISVGNGHLELVGRISFEGFKTNSSINGIQNRNNPIPLGIGTRQLTNVGAFFLYGFYDITSGGYAQEFTYATKFNYGKINFYPQLGLEMRSAKYVNYLYGVNSAQATASGLSSYTAHASNIPVLGLAMEVPIDNSWNINFQYRTKWLDNSITNSPLVSTKTQYNGFVGLTYSYK